MTKAEFDQLLIETGLSIRWFAKLTGQNRGTVWGWGRQRFTGSGPLVQAFPIWVTPLLTGWRDHPETLLAWRETRQQQEEATQAAA